MHFSIFFKVKEFYFKFAWDFDHKCLLDVPITLKKHLFVVSENHFPEKNKLHLNSIQKIGVASVRGVLITCHLQKITPQQESNH